MNKNMLAFLLAALLLGTSLLAAPTVNAAKNTPYANGYSEGYFIKSENNRIYYEEYDGTFHNIAFDSKTNLLIDNRPVKISDFKKGMEIYVKLKNKNIYYMDSFSTSSPGYITPDSRERSGRVKDVSQDQITIITAIGTEETYFASPATLVSKDGKNTTLNALYAGDRVRLKFSDLSSKTASKILIEGDSVIIKDLYRGVLSVTERMSRFVTVQNVERFRNGNWEKIGTMRMPYSTDLALFMAGKEIDYKKLDSYKGKTVYMAVKDFFGKEGAEKMVIRNQQEMSFSEKIEQVNWYTSEIKLSNKRNIGFNDGTMVIKNGRLVDNYSILPNSSALVVADGRASSSTANVIYIYDEDINNSKSGMDKIYAARVDNIGEYILNIKDFSVLDKNKWQSFNQSMPLYFDEETSVYDMEKKKTLTVKEFMDGEYHVDEDNITGGYVGQGGILKDYNAYIYTDGDRISSIYLKKDMDSILNQRVSTATVESLKDDASTGLTLNLRDGKDWSDRLEKWNLRYGTMNLRVNDALIVKNGKAITAKQLKIGDRLYIVRDDLDGKVIVVK